MVESELAAPATTATAAPIAIKVLTLRPATVVPAAAPAAAVPVAGAAAGAGVDWAIACAEAKHRIAEAIRIFFMGYPLRLNRGNAKLSHDCSNISCASLCRTVDGDHNLCYFSLILNHPPWFGSSGCCSALTKAIFQASAVAGCWESPVRTPEKTESRLHVCQVLAIPRKMQASRV